MKKVLNLALLITSLFVYLEWGKGYSAFLFEAEIELFSQLRTQPEGFLHPFVLLPLVGQLVLLLTLFQKTPGRWLSLVGTACLSALVLFVFFISLLALNWKILVSTMPFLLVAILVVQLHWERSAKA